MGIINSELLVVEITNSELLVVGITNSVSYY